MNWNDIKKTMPVAYQSGDWDGLKSDKVLVCTIRRKYYVVEMYHGILDGEEFCDFYDGDVEVKNVAFWAEIDAPF